MLCWTDPLEENNCMLQTALQYASIDIQSVCMYIYIYGFQIFAVKQSTIPAKFGHIYLWARLISF